MSELRTLAIVAIIIGAVVGLAARFIFFVPDLYCVMLGLSASVMFFFIVLWSSYVFIYH